MEEIRQLDRKTRKLLTLQRIHHPKADMDRMYLLRNEGGRGLIQLQTAYKTATIGLDTYLDTKNDPLLVIAKEPEKKKQRKKYPYLARLRFSIFNLLETLEPENEALTVYARKVRQKARCHAQDQLKQKWEDKPMHGQYQKE